MNPRKSKRINRLVRKSTSVLKKTSFSNYRSLLLRLCSHHSDLEFVPNVVRLLEVDDWDGLLALADSLASQKYETAGQHFSANQFAALIRKYPFPPRVINTDPRKKALDTFGKAERKCSRLNRIFKLFEKRSPYESYLAKMRGFIRFVMDDVPDIDAVYGNCSFGAGASVGVHGNATNVGRKITVSKWSSTPSAFTHGFNAVMSHAQLRNYFLEKQGMYCYDKDFAFSSFKSRMSFVSYNKISFVPKTARTERTIAVEPLVNGYLQKGVDVYLRTRLKRIGINLEDQTRNQEMARKGSLEDSPESFATIDLSSASDSISVGLVKNLVPDDWYRLLDGIRSKEYECDGVIKTYHKFCSMGNGFCFPLESLIFTAACHAIGAGVPGTDYSVYGDDIIVRQKYALELIWLLKKIGFSTNKSKTFVEGPFRESCGADWFDGTNVRPFTLDFALDSVEGVFKFLNITKERALTSIFFKELRPYIMSLVPVDLQLVRPFKGNHDSGIDGYNDEFLSSGNCFFQKKKQHLCWYELEHRPVLDERPISAGADDESVWMYALLFGAQSNNGRHAVKLYLRRKTRTTVILTGHGGATSTWLPSN